MNGKVFYGPHNCDLCGATIVRAALEDGATQTCRALSAVERER